jgi:hypothetical protein
MRARKPASVKGCARCYADRMLDSPVKGFCAGVGAVDGVAVRPRRTVAAVADENMRSKSETLDRLAAEGYARGRQHVMAD